MNRKSTRKSVQMGRGIAKLISIASDLKQAEMAGPTRTITAPAADEKDWKALWRSELQASKQLRKDNARLRAQIEDMKRRKLANFSIEDIMKEIDARVNRAANK